MDNTSFDNPSLLNRLRELATAERTATTDFLACMEEADKRDAVLEEGYSSLFDFCVRDLNLAESTAYQRVQCARAAAERPEIYRLVREGVINLTNLTLIASHLKRHPSLLQRIVGRRKREVESIVAEIVGAPERPETVRIVAAPAAPEKISEPANDLFAEPPSVAAQPVPRASAAAGPESPAGAVAAVTAPARIQLQPKFEYTFTASAEFARDLDRLRGLLWHKHPNGRLVDVLEEAVRDYLKRCNPERQATTVAKATDPRARRVSKAVRRAIWRRDQGRCAFISSDGRRCEARAGLELDHVTPWALGGPSDDPANLRLLCRAHNQWAARQAFGERADRRAG